jgi:cytochrome b561
MESKATKRLAVFLSLVVLFLSVCDVFIVVTSPWWLHTIYQGDYQGLRIMLGYNFSTSQIIYPLMLAFFILCGLLCLGILAAAYRILRRIRQSMPFCARNAVSLRNAALCSFGLFVIFMLKMFFSASILTFVCGGMFLLFGLFVMVMSQLVLEAARLKEESELTI